MEKYYKEYTVGSLIRDMRVFLNLTQKDFSNKIGKSINWLSDKELNIKRIYINDFANIIKIFGFRVTFIYFKDIRSITLNDHEPKDFLRILRELTEKNQSQFSNEIGRTNFWQNLNENGKTKFYANDLFLLASKNGYEIKLSYKGDKYEN